MSNEEEGNVVIHVVTWKEDYVKHIKGNFGYHLSVMHKLAGIAKEKSLLARIDKVTGMLKASVIDYEELAFAYNQLNKDVSEWIGGHEVLLPMIKILSKSFVEKGIIFDEMYVPEEWLERTVKDWCKKIRSLNECTRGVDFDSLATWYEKQLEKDKDISPSRWAMLKALFRTWDVTTDAMVVMQDIPKWFKDGSPNEFEMLDKLKAYVKNMDWLVPDSLK